MSVIETISQSIQRDLQHLKHLSDNVANVNTPGYQSIQSFDAVVNNQKTYAHQVISTKLGAIKDSERTLDFAITSQGYFLIEKNDELFATRYGRFHISADGWLTHVSGGKLLANSGAIHVGSSNVSISEDGSVHIDGKETDQLKLIETQHLTLGASAGLYSINGPINFLGKVQIKSNAINTSNVDSGEQMTNMINLNRHVQSLQKAASAYDQMLNAGINELGKK